MIGASDEDRRKMQSLLSEVAQLVREDSTIEGIVVQVTRIDPTTQSFVTAYKSAGWVQYEPNESGGFDEGAEIRKAIEEADARAAEPVGKPADAVDRPPIHTDESLNAKLQDTTSSRILSRPEFCSMLTISYSTSERWAREDFGPRPFKIGPRRLGYRLADVLAFIAERSK